MPTFPTYLGDAGGTPPGHIFIAHHGHAERFGGLRGGIERTAQRLKFAARLLRVSGTDQAVDPQPHCLRGNGAMCELLTELLQRSCGRFGLAAVRQQRIEHRLGIVMMQINKVAGEGDQIRLGGGKLIDDLQRRVAQLEGPR